MYSCVMMDTWDKYFFDIVDVVCKKSKDPDTKVGCVIVGPDHEIRSTGYNGFCRGVDDSEERWKRPTKYWWVEHAERNAVYNAARCGTSLLGCTAYVQIIPCVDCARALIQSGVSRVCVSLPHVVARAKDMKIRLSPEKYVEWLDDCRQITTLFEESGVTYCVLYDKNYLEELEVDVNELF